MNQEGHEISVSLRDLVGFVVRGAFLAVLVGSVLGAAAYFWTEQQPPVFRAESTLLVARSTGGFTQFGLTPAMAPPIDLSAYRAAAASDAVLADAMRRLGVDEPSMQDTVRLRSDTDTFLESGVRDSSLLRVEARGGVAQLAVVRANAVAEALVEWDQRRATESIRRVIATLEQQVEALTEQIRSLQTVDDEAGQDQVDGLVRLRAEQLQQLAYARALVLSAEGLISVIQPADSTPRQVAPRPAMSAGVAAIIGIVLAYTLMLLRAAMDTRLRGSDDIATVTGLPMLAELPALGRQQAGRLREASSYLRANLLFATDEVHPRAFLVTSALKGEGKTTVSRNLAESFARQGYRTLLVDADLRAPSVIDDFHVVGSLPEGTATESWLRDPWGDHHVLTITIDTEVVLDVIPQLQGSPESAELLGRGFRAALSRWQEYDIIVIDGGPLLAVADPLTIAPHCTGTLLVVDVNMVDRRKLLAAVALLRRVGVQVLGFVANKVEKVTNAAGYGAGGYGTAYGDHHATRSKTRNKASAAIARTKRFSGDA